MKGKRCLVCDSPVEELDGLSTDWEKMGDTKYYKCTKCKKVFAFPKHSAVAILIDVKKWAAESCSRADKAIHRLEAVKKEAGR